MSKVITIYGEKYKPRKVPAMPHQTVAIAQEADAAYVVEQGEMEIPSLGKQRRMFSVIRFERIIREGDP